MAQVPDNDRPTEKQLRFLRSLACSRGETFSSPATRAEASAEIQRLKDRKPSSRVETRIDRKAVAEAFERRGGGARVRDHEVTGYGSTASWRERG